MSSLIIVLGDQLTKDLAVLNEYKDGDLVLMAEVEEKHQAVNHHRKKLAFIYSAMRHFAEDLTAKDVNLSYVRFEDSTEYDGIIDIICSHLDELEFDELVITEPGEYWLTDAIEETGAVYNIEVRILPDSRFISTTEEFSDWAEDRKELVMEYWYRLMRKKTGVLMDGKDPIGGKWNFDKQNRKTLKPGEKIKAPRKFRPDETTLSVLQMVKEHYPDGFGDLEPFWYAVTASQARKALRHFIKYHLQSFGDYQDAMLTDEAFLYHSVISQYINCGLLDPLETCQQAEQAYHRGDAPINAVEGFIRQIIGWREYIRGVYWLYMPDYKDLNKLDARRELPDFYWDGNTQMNCLSQVVNMTRKYAYSHHIQRLMVSGNFANLAGIDVNSVCNWYLGVYADAHEWVELPNTLGMALYADGGLVGSKPYISTGNYIKRMSNYCDSCEYDPGKRVGEKACPFTTLYWDYLIRHKDKLKGNQRMSLSYRNLDRFSTTDKKQIQQQAAEFLDTL